MKQKMIRTMTLLGIIAIMGSCAVQQFPVNTKTQPFDNGGTVFGEKTKGKEYKKAREFFIIGINVSSCDTKHMAEQIKADHYTIETRHTFWSGLVYYVTFSLVDYKIVKVIKREN